MNPLTAAPLDREAGYRMLASLQDEQAQQGTLAALDELAPGFPDWIVTALFGGTYQRDGLALRDRQIANLAALTAMGGVEPQLAQHVAASLRVGMAPTEIVEVLVHLAPYVGVPKALAGLRVAAGVLAQSGEQVTPQPASPSRPQA
ncbi:carboxymuconolactone decarboxylase family protein [Kitasatospora sp. NBC_00070]|uniref:carboxymuconolactone decarboxylase family protein n=1 Tax=Kitasatospora sp. NBC_00070 TaxID=2975962 RepID=UPI00324DB970